MAYNWYTLVSYPAPIPEGRYAPEGLVQQTPPEGCRKGRVPGFSDGNFIESPSKDKYQIFPNRIRAR